MLVYGPPGAGKTTWVLKQAQARDLVLDYDELLASVSMHVTGSTPTQRLFVSTLLHSPARLADVVPEGCTAWIVVATADQQKISDYLGSGFDVVRVIADPDVCKQRCRKRGGRGLHPAGWKAGK